MTAETLCAVDGCGRPTRSRGWCASHYRRLLTTGDVRADEPLRGDQPPPPATRRCCMCGARIRRQGRSAAQYAAATTCSRRCSGLKSTGQPQLPVVPVYCPPVPTPCSTGNPDDWTPDVTVRARDARDLCAGCPVASECLAAGMDAGADGIYGGIQLTTGRPRLVVAVTA